MQVDFVITELNVGGAERTLTRLAIGLANAGGDVRVFSIGSKPVTPRDELVAQLDAAGIDATFANADSTLALPNAFASLRRWLSRRPQAIRQSFLFHANVLLAAAAPKGNRLVAGIRVAEPNRLRISMERWAMRRFNRVVCVSGAVANFAAKQLQVSPERTRVITNGIEVASLADVPPIDWSTLGWSSTDQVVLFVGRFHPQKGLDLLMDSLGQFAPPDSGRRLLLVGDGPLRSQLKSWAGAEPGDRVGVLPWTANVAELISACDLLVLPSRYEGMPNVVLEAMAASKPVVCSRVEGIEELLGQDHSQTFPSGDAIVMSRCLNELLANHEFAKKVGAANHARVSKLFTMERVIEQYRELYRQLAGE